MSDSSRGMAVPVNGRGMEAEALQGKQVLVVEDDPQVGRMLKLMLQRQGLDVAWVDHVDAARHRLEAPIAFDLLLTDVVLPGGENGADLAAGIRESFPDFPIIITTGYDRSSVAQYPGLLESITFLPKPFTLDQVRDALVAELVDRPAGRLTQRRSGAGR